MNQNANTGGNPNPNAPNFGQLDAVRSAYQGGQNSMGSMLAAAIRQNGASMAQTPGAIDTPTAQVLPQTTPYNALPQTIAPTLPQAQL